jgi:hypothetical protein
MLDFYPDDKLALERKRKRKGTKKKRKKRKEKKGTYFVSNFHS